MRTVKHSLQRDGNVVRLPADRWRPAPPQPDWRKQNFCDLVQAQRKKQPARESTPYDDGNDAA